MGPFKNVFQKAVKKVTQPLNKLGGKLGEAPKNSSNNIAKKGFLYKPDSVDMKDVGGMLKESYNKNAQNVGSYNVDKQLSSKHVKVYHDPVSNQVVVAHKGSSTLQDWKENAKYLFGMESGKNWKKSKDAQKKAEEKYRGAHLTTIGHSKGASHAEKFGKHGEVITLNKPVSVKDLFKKKVGSHQTDYKSSRDPVSILRNLQKGKKAKVIQSKTFNPLTEHGTGVLGRLKKPR
jgi:hypothetical protein